VSNPCPLFEISHFVNQKECDESSNQQRPSELPRAPFQKAIPVFDFCARIEFMVGTG
jgi:hypothetical protein